VTTAAPEAPPVAPPPSPHRKPPPPRPERPVEMRHPPREAPPVETPPVEARAQAAEAPPQIARAPAAPVPSAPAGPPPDYLAMLQAALQRSLEYPRSARQAGIQGYPVLRFVIDRAGRVLESRLVRSSGHEVLDRAAEATLRRAAPFPPIPDSIGQPRMEIEVPVGFRLR
jgi:periplasmic protein TonB